MRKKPAKAEAIAYLKRWRIVNEYERTELRRTPMARKLQQLATLMASAALFPKAAALTAEDEETWERWNLLRKEHRRG